MKRVKKNKQRIGEVTWETVKTMSNVSNVLQEDKPVY